MRTLTWRDVESAVRRIGLATNVAEAPAYTLVNLDTTFWTTPHPLSRTLNILGYTVDVDVQPTSYTWHWGDGTTRTTDSPGSPYPDTTITHTYRHHTAPAHPRTITIDTTYTARYRVDGGAWATIPDTITVTGPPVDLPVRQASPVLVGR